MLSQTILDHALPQSPAGWLVLALSLGALMLAAPWTRRKARDGLPEPPILASNIPYFGHVIGLSRQGYRYYTNLCFSTSMSIFTLPVMSERLIFAKPAVERVIASKPVDLSLWHFVFQTLLPLLFSLPAAKEKYKGNKIPAIASITHRALLNRSNLEGYVHSAADYIQLKIRDVDKQPVRFGEWIDKITARSVAFAVWGPGNPWLDGDLLWHFRNLTENAERLKSPFPQLTAPSVVRSRKIALDSLYSFYTEDNGRAPSQMIADMQDVVSGIKFVPDPQQNLAVPDVLLATGLLSNIGASAEWTAHHIFSDAKLLARVRSEVETLVDNNHVINISRVKSACPWLVATWHEVLRLHTNSLVRGAAEDVDLDGQYLIPAGSTLIMPQTTYHQDPAVWGDDAESFRPGRFIGADGKIQFKLLRKLRAWGISGALCPGRHMTFTVVMATLAALALSVDIEPANGALWKIPNVKWALAVGVQRCEGDVEVVMSKKKEWEGRDWILECGDALENDQFQY